MQCYYYDLSHVSAFKKCSSTLNLTHWKRPWCWEGLGAGGEGDDRGWDGWMASLTWWIWVWVNSGSWWWTGRPGMLQFMGSQRLGHDWATELNWTDTQSQLLHSQQTNLLSSLMSCLRPFKVHWLKNKSSETKAAWLRVTVLASCVTLDRTVNLFEPQFSHL